jgi:hypothetical protein
VQNPLAHSESDAQGEPSGSLFWHAPATQDPGPQDTPQSPQWAGSVATSTQPDPHETVPAGHPAVTT